MKGENMRLHSKWFGFFLIVLLVLVESGLCADVAKIGVVDFQQLFEQSEAGKKVKEQITAEGKKMEAELKGKGSEIEDLKKRLEREALVMSKEMREEKERDFRIKVNDIKMLQKKYESELQNMQKHMMGDLQQDVISIIEEIGKSGGYLMIVEKRAVLYSPSTIDITGEVVKKYNTAYAAKNK